ncbi:BI2L1 protein, partial [Atractosteus spatula]|nr:BI2L1 protein [Atractosteus spatula]
MKGALVFVCLSVTVVYLRTDVPEDEASPNGIAAKVLGALRFRQLDGNMTYIRSNGELASDTLTEAAFEISDPLNLLSSASFSYTWDLGDGHVVVSTESYVHHTYSSSGNYTMRLKVEAYWTEREDRRRSPRSGTYSSDLKVLDAVRSVEVTGPSSVEVDQSTLLSLAVNGRVRQHTDQSSRYWATHTTFPSSSDPESPPLTLCWVMVPDCGPLPPVRCHLVRLQGTTLSLHYTFGSAGRYCLRLTARNDVSLLQTFHAFTVGSGATQHVLFILPCATLILITLGFIVFAACRPHRSAHKHRVEASCPGAVETKREDAAGRPRGSGGVMGTPARPAAGGLVWEACGTESCLTQPCRCAVPTRQIDVGVMRNICDLETKALGPLWPLPLEPLRGKWVACGAEPAVRLNEAEAAQAERLCHEGSGKAKVKQGVGISLKRATSVGIGPGVTCRPSVAVQRMNVMEQFNPGLRNLVNLGKSYEKAAAAMSLAGRAYFDAVSKIGENAAVSPVSRELGVVLMEISEVQKKIHLELEENFKKFHKEIIAELEKKTEMDVKYMTATFKRYQTEHKLKLDSLERSQSDLKKLRRKSQGKNAIKYESKESEWQDRAAVEEGQAASGAGAAAMCIETITSRQEEIQRFIAEGCREALLEEKRRFCFLVDKHCTFSYQISSFHDKARDALNAKLPAWQEKCSDATRVPDSVLSMIEGLRTPVSVTPQPSPVLSHSSVQSTDVPKPPPAPPLKAQTSPLVDMFSPAAPKASVTTQRSSGKLNPKTDPSTFSDVAGCVFSLQLLHLGMFKSPSTSNVNSGEDSSLSRSISVSTGLNMIKRPKVRTIFPHTAGSNDTLLSFEEGDVITLLIPEEKDGWLYGELDKTRHVNSGPAERRVVFMTVPWTVFLQGLFTTYKLGDLHAPMWAAHTHSPLLLNHSVFWDRLVKELPCAQHRDPPLRKARRGWFPSSYCRPYIEPLGSSRCTVFWQQLVIICYDEKVQDQLSVTPARSVSVANLADQDRGAMVLPPPDYNDSSPTRTAPFKSTPSSPEHTVSEPNGIPKLPFLGGGNPFTTVKLRPTVTNDRSAPII